MSSNHLVEKPPEKELCVSSPPRLSVRGLLECLISATLAEMRLWEVIATSKDVAKCSKIGKDPRISTRARWLSSIVGFPFLPSSANICPWNGETCDVDMRETSPKVIERPHSKVLDHLASRVPT